MDIKVIITNFILQLKIAIVFLYFGLKKTIKNIMKYLLFLFIATLFFIKSYGQLEKRNWLIGGNGSLYSYNETFRSPSYNHYANYTNIDLSATIGYFLKDKFVSGI